LSDLGHQLSSEISPNTLFSRVQKNLESPLLLQILLKTSSIWAFLALLYRGEVAVAVMIMAAACLTQCVRFGSQQHAATSCIFIFSSFVVVVVVAIAHQHLKMIRNSSTPPHTQNDYLNYVTKFILGPQRARFLFFPRTACQSPFT
jgi:hypothetical protein